MLFRKVAVVSAALAMLAATPVVTPAISEESGAMDNARALKAKREREAEEGYRRSLNNIDNKNAKLDPWGNMRSAEPAAAATTTGTSKKK